MKFIIISGTPGTGKTTISNHLCNYINAEVISLNELILEWNYVLAYDQKRETAVIDEDQLNKNMERIIQDYSKPSLDYLIIESHFTDIISEAYMDYVIILRCHPDELYSRLKKRGYRKEKIIENIQSEILGSSVNYFIEKNLNIQLYEIDTTESDINAVVKIIVDIIEGNEELNEYCLGYIDWLEELSDNGRLSEYFN